MTRIIGHVSALARFPVKSMIGERPAAVDIDWQGIEGDRQYAFYFRRNGTRFPWATARKVAGMALYRAAFADPNAPKTSPVAIETPEGERFELRDAGLHARLEALFGEPIGLIQIARGNYDSMPISLQTRAGHARLEEAHGSPIDPRRFRVNITIDSDIAPEALCRMRLGFGDDPGGALLQCADPIDRCVFVTIDPDTGVKDPSILRTVARQFDNCYGIYSTPARPGAIRIGDAVRLLD